MKFNIITLSLNGLKTNYNLIWHFFFNLILNLLYPSVCTSLYLMGTSHKTYTLQIKIKTVTRVIEKFYMISFYMMV